MENEIMNEKRFAVLIDSENVSAKYISYVFGELTSYGIATYKRIYGDWTNTQSSSWKECLLDYAVVPIQQFRNTHGKNATDSTLIIDAMDILYEGNVQGFCIVSSDGDFTRLASRLCESGMEVIGMGEKKTPSSFVNACNRFIYLENLLEEEELEETETKSKVSKKEIGTTTTTKSVEKNKTSSTSITPKKVIINDIVEIITVNSNKGRETDLGEIGSRLVQKYSNFDARNYGYSLLSKLIEELPGLKSKKKNNRIIVELGVNSEVGSLVDSYIVKRVKEQGATGMSLGVLGREIHENFPQFTTKDYGYSNLSKYVQHIAGIEVTQNQNGSKQIKPRD